MITVLKGSAGQAGSEPCTRACHLPEEAGVGETSRSSPEATGKRRGVGLGPRVEGGSSYCWRTRDTREGPVELQDPQSPWAPEEGEPTRFIKCTNLEQTWDQQTERRQSNLNDSRDSKVTIAYLIRTSGMSRQEGWSLAGNVRWDQVLSMWWGNIN